MFRHIALGLEFTIFKKKKEVNPYTGEWGGSPLFPLVLISKIFIVKLCRIQTQYHLFSRLLRYQRATPILLCLHNLPCLASVPWKNLFSCVTLFPKSPLDRGGGQFQRVKSLQITVKCVWGCVCVCAGGCKLQGK